MAAGIPEEIVAFAKSHGFPETHPHKPQWTGENQRATCHHCGKEGVNGPCGQDPGTFFAKVYTFADLYLSESDDSDDDGEDEMRFTDICGFEAFDRLCSGSKFANIMTPVGPCVSAKGKHPVGMMLAGDTLCFLDSMNKLEIVGTHHCLYCDKDATTFVVDRDEPAREPWWEWYCDDHLSEIDPEDGDVVPIVYWAN